MRAPLSPLLLLLLLLAIGASIVSVSVVLAAPDLQFGSSLGFSGTPQLADFSADFRNGLSAAVAPINDAGGIGGRTLHVNFTDDAGDATLGSNFAQGFIADGVLGVLGSSGPAVSGVLLPILSPAKVPLIGAGTGSKKIRTPYNAYAINIRSSTDDQISAIVRYALSIGRSTFSIAHAKDAPSLSNVADVQAALANQGLSLLSTAAFTDETDVVAAYQQLRDNNLRPAVAIILGPPAAIAKFIQAARQTTTAGQATLGDAPGADWNGAGGRRPVLIVTLALYGAEAVGEAIRSNGGIYDDVAITTVSPLARGYSQLQADAAQEGNNALLDPSSLSYQFAVNMRDYCSSHSDLPCKASQNAMEGWVVGKTVLQVLTQLGEITPASVAAYISNNAFFDASLASADHTEVNTFLATNPSPFYLEDARVAPYVRDQFLATFYAVTIQIGQYTYRPLAKGACNSVSKEVGAAHFVTQDTSTGLPPYAVKQLYLTPLGACNANSIVVPTGSRPIVFGQSAAFTGSSAYQGLAVNRGLRAAFNQVNQAGGVGSAGRSLNLVSFDDAYIANQTVSNSQQLVQAENVVALIGIVGTGSVTSLASSSVLQGTNMALISPITGGRQFREPFVRNIINLRPSYDDEVAASITYFRSALNKNVLTVFLLFSTDAFGKAVNQSADLVTEYYRGAVACKATFVAGTSNIASAANSLLACGVPDVVILASVSIDPLANFLATVEATTNAPWAKVQYTIVSAVDPQAFVDALNAQPTVPTSALNGHRITMRSLMPPIYRPQDSPLVAMATAALLANNDTTPLNANILEGYIAGLFAAKVAGVSATADSTAYLNTIYSAGAVQLASGVGGVYGPLTDVGAGACNQASHAVYLLTVPEFTIKSTFDTGACGVYRQYNGQVVPDNTHNINAAAPLHQAHGFLAMAVSVTLLATTILTLAF